MNKSKGEIHDILREYPRIRVGICHNKACANMLWQFSNKEI